MEEPAKRAHVMTAAELSRALRVDLSRGLSPAEVLRRRALHGTNELPADAPTPMWRLVLEQFDDKLVKILLAAAAVSFFFALTDDSDSLRAMAEPAVILIILILNAIVGVWQESNAAKAIEALKQYEPDAAVVLRTDDAPDPAPSSATAPALRTVHARELVPGDVVRVAVGDRIPADLRLLELASTTLRVDQALLTGENEAVLKDTAALDPGADASAEIQAKANMAFAGTTVAYGAAVGVVVSTGSATEMGKIGVQVAETKAAASPLKVRLDEFGDLLSRLIGAICVFVWLINIGHFRDAAFGGSAVRGAVYYFKIAVALAVAAIPEGLPAVVTTCLALGTRRMARRHAIARSLPSVETLGTTNVICSDKTGTLTTSQMSARRALTLRRAGGGGVAACAHYALSGSSYAPHDGALHAADAASPARHEHCAEPSGAAAARADALGDAALITMAAVSALCNHAHVQREAGGAFSCVGEPTEAALRVLCEKWGRSAGVTGALAASAALDGAATAGAISPSISARALGAPASPTALAAAAEAAAPQPSLEPASLAWLGAWQPRAFLEFSRDRKSMSVLCERAPDETLGAVAAAADLPPAALAGVGGGVGGGGGGGAARWCLFVKGAVESVLGRCTHALLADGAVVPLTHALRVEVLEEEHGLSSGAAALRTLALAVRTDFSEWGGRCPPPAVLADVGSMATVESSLVFVGVVGITDPVRPEVAASIRTCRAAGVRVVVITGDNKGTALAVCRQAGVVGAEEEEEERGTAESDDDACAPPGAGDAPGGGGGSGGFFDGGDGGGGAAAAAAALGGAGGGAPPDLESGGATLRRRRRRRYTALTGREFAALPRAEQLRAASECALYARTEPAHKLQLVSLLQSLGDVVAMTGDGVNDAPALKKADIGIAMGSGTAVAKGAADMILADDNFATIVAAVEEGRSIFNNTKAFIRYLISSNIGEVVAIVTTAALGMPEALVPVQLLWVNLVTDGLPAMALSFNPPDADVMAQRPRKKSEKFIDGWLLFRYVAIGIYVGAATVGAFAWWFVYAADGPRLSAWQLLHCHQCGAAEGGAGGAFEGVRCAVFTDHRPRSVALSTLVMIEMLNALNAISENCSLLSMPPWCNGWLLLAIALSVLQHVAILYVPVLASIFGVAPLGAEEWGAVLAASAPVLLLDEVLKAITRARLRAAEAAAAGGAAGGARHPNPTAGLAARAVQLARSVSATGGGAGGGAGARAGYSYQPVDRFREGEGDSSKSA